MTPDSQTIELIVTAYATARPQHSLWQLNIETLLPDLPPAIKTSLKADILTLKLTTTYRW